MATSGSSTSDTCGVCHGALNRASLARTRRPVGALDSADDGAGSSPADRSGAAGGVGRPAGTPSRRSAGSAAGPGATSAGRSGRTLRSDNAHP
ncbi:hypothetical protein GCM10022220_41410 [Actinocatenispora rupis]|uniref:Uncharacterized protein n=1 Tax=Actinocatenispora rupis TaxID=519421 RepID=A0A8J3NBS1_9ACTN|nr:hypothetical protein Aru02nite_05330 [Actinocatenispora rupis]